MLKESNIPKIHFISSIILVIFLSICIGYYYISSEFNHFNKLVNDIEKKYIEEQKEYLHNEVTNIVLLLEYENSQMYKGIKQKLENRVNQIYKVTNKIYHTNLSNNDCDIDILTRNIKNIALSFNWKNSQTSIDVLDGLNYTEGYIHQDIDNNLYAIVYKKFPKLNFTYKISTNLTLASKDLKLQLINRIKDINLRNNSSIFLFNKDFKILYHPAIKGDGLDNLDDKNSIELIKNISKTVKNNQFYEYKWKDTLSNTDKKKFFYAKEFEQYKWIIVSSIDLDKVKQVVDIRKEELEHTTMDNIKTTVLIFLIFLIIAIIASFIFTKKLSNVFINYQENIKRQKEEIINSNELLNTIIDSTEDLISYKDNDFKYIMCNEAFCNFLGKTKDEIIGKDDFDLFDIELANIFREEDTYIINNEDSIYVENILHDAKGNGLHFYTHKSTLKNKNNEIVGIVGFAKNFTETQNLINQLSNTNQALEEKVKTRTFELEELNKSLEKRVLIELEKNRQKDKIVQNSIRQAQMGEMLSMIAHQWRQPLSTISTIAGNMRIEIELDAFTKESVISELEQIEVHTQFLSRTINDFRNFFNPNKLKETIYLNDIITKSISIFSKNIENSKIKLENNCKFDERIETYSNEVMQVILNMIKNSIDVFKEREIENPTIIINSKENSKSQIIEVIDNGGGIDDSVIDKVFDPYFSTKDEKNGTGLGLYMSKTIIEEHCQGKLSVENYKNGCKFTIEFFKNSKGE